MTTNSTYHNISFRDALANELGLYTNLAYSVDKVMAGCFDLSINSTSMSELDGSDEGYLGSFSYMSSKEIKEDLEQAKKDYPNTVFDEI